MNSQDFLQANYYWNEENNSPNLGIVKLVNLKRFYYKPTVNIRLEIVTNQHNLKLFKAIEKS